MKKLLDFNSHWKVLPPLRSSADAQALLAGVADGTIDVIATNHSPWDEEAKNLEFPYAEFGMTGLETAFALCRTFLHKKLPVNTLVEKMALAPRRVLGLPAPEIRPGARADISVFDPDLEWTFGEKDIRSRSHNTPFAGWQFKGKALGIVNNGQVVRNP